MPAPLPGAFVSRAVMGSPAKVVAATCSGASVLSTFFYAAFATASMRA